MTAHVEALPVLPTSASGEDSRGYDLFQFNLPHHTLDGFFSTGQGHEPCRIFPVQVKNALPTLDFLLHTSFGVGLTTIQLKGIGIGLIVRRDLKIKEGS